MSTWREQISGWLHKHLFSPMYAMTRVQKAVSIFIGFWFGVFPIPGLTTPVLFAAMFCINRVVEHPLSTAEYTVATAINLLSTPVLFILLPTWIHLGQMLVGSAGQCDVGQLTKEFSDNGLLQTLSDFAQCLFMATFAWALYTPFFLCIALIFRGRVLLQQEQRLSESDSPIGKQSSGSR
jgi:hypothetical protein